MLSTTDSGPHFTTQPRSDGRSAMTTTYPYVVLGGTGRIVSSFRTWRDAEAYASLRPGLYSTISVSGSRCHSCLADTAGSPVEAIHDRQDGGWWLVHRVCP